MFFRSERLFLRPGWPEDWTELFSRIAGESSVRDPAIAPWLHGVGDACPFATHEQDRLHPHLLVTLPTSEGAQLIGCVGLVAGETAGDNAELGYWISRDHRNRGFATEACRGVLALARVLGHARLSASHASADHAPARVLRKLGFRPTGQVGNSAGAAGGPSPTAAAYHLDLGPAGNCDDDGSPAMRAA